MLAICTAMFWVLAARNPPKAQYPEGLGGLPLPSPPACVREHKPLSTDWRGLVLDLWFGNPYVTGQELTGLIHDR